MHGPDRGEEDHRQRFLTQPDRSNHVLGAVQVAIATCISIQTNGNIVCKLLRTSKYVLPRHTPIVLAYVQQKKKV
jgi:hypothetical protein